MDYQTILDEIQQEIQPLLGLGKVANYIPALAKVDPNQFAMSITLFDGTQYSVGDADTLFSIQSISKVFTFTLALKFYSKSLYERIGIEPSGNPFNSLVQLEYEHGKPRNPFINAGAINVTDTLISYYDHNSSATFNEIVDFIRSISDNKYINFDVVVAESEMDHGYRNLALAHMMKSFGNLDNDPTEVFRHI